MSNTHRVTDRQLRTATGRSKVGRTTEEVALRANMTISGTRRRLHRLAALGFIERLEGRPTRWRALTDPVYRKP